MTKKLTTTAATSVEYALLAGLVGAVVVGSVVFFERAASASFETPARLLADLTPRASSATPAAPPSLGAGGEAGPSQGETAPPADVPAPWGAGGVVCMFISAGGEMMDPAALQMTTGTGPEVWPLAPNGLAGVTQMMDGFPMGSVLPFWFGSDAPGPDLTPGLDFLFVLEDTNGNGLIDADEWEAGIAPLTGGGPYAWAATPEGVAGFPGWDTFAPGPFIWFGGAPFDTTAHHYGHHPLDLSDAVGGNWALHPATLNVAPEDRDAPGLAPGGC